MSPSLKMQSPMRQASNSAATNGFGPSEVTTCRFDLRDTLAATVVRELSFAEFRAALEKSGKRLS
jgi:hypothetical protein